MLLLLMLPSASMAVWWSPVINSTLARAGQDFDSVAMEGFTRSVELFEQMEAALQSIVGPDAQDRGFGLVSANTVYNNLASSSTVLKVIIINICQLFFNSVGWYLVSWIWSILRQVVVPQYPIHPLPNQSQDRIRELGSRFPGRIHIPSSPQLRVCCHKPHWSCRLG